MPTMRSIETLEELVALAVRQDDLFVRWSADPAADQQRGSSVDELTGVELPGLSANPLRVESWRLDRPLDVWVARRLYDYKHLRERRGRDVRPWLLTGEVVGRGPDNEPLVRCHEAVAWLADSVTNSANDLIEAQPRDWGTLDRG
jgi:hypothetical protein